MGAKFNNLNIYHGNIAALRDLMPGLDYYQVTPDWVTAVSANFSWGQVQSVAKELSKLANATLLSTEYFDDDYVEFAVYTSGKRFTKHVPVEYEGLPRKKGSPKAFFTAFHMDLMDQKAFQKALAVEDCEESVALMESFLGCPILGICVDNPPIDPPGRAEADRLRGGACELTARVLPNPAMVDEPPYPYNPEQPAVPVGGQSVCCFTDQPKKVIQKLKKYVDRLAEDNNSRIFTVKLEIALYERIIQSGKNPVGDRMPTSSDIDGLQAQLEKLELEAPYSNGFGGRHDIRVLLRPGRVVIHGIGFGCADACAPDDSRFYRSLVLLTTLQYGYDQANLELAMAYGGKLLCHGIRGMEPRQYHNKVLENLVLDSPWLNLSEGALTSAFQRPNLGEAIAETEKLLGTCITPIPPDHYPMVEEYGCLRVYRDAQKVKELS